ncbi:MAG: hypothetical protein RJA22_3103 [Verrucomicrobiota bacterium]|jgi:quinol monooxygenase YgiN
MKYTLSTFSVGEKNLKHARRALAELVAALRRHEPRTLYLVFREEDAPAFRCMMAFPDEAAERAHAQSAHVARFARRMQALCEGTPTFTELGCFLSTHARWDVEEAALAAVPVPAPRAHAGRGRAGGRWARRGGPLARP